MKIRYLGHSSFQLIESTGTTIVTDPYSSSLGSEMPAVTADAVTVSHHHYDHDSVERVGGKPLVIDKEGSYELDGVDINSIRSFHDPEGGRLRGENIIFKFSMDGIEVCHLGDIGEECSTELIEALLPVDVLLIPVGGTYTIDAEQAKEYVDRIMPDIVIPMHYREKGKKLDVDRVEEFTDLFDEEEVDFEGGSEIDISREDLGGDTTRIIVMEKAED
ncbi:MAG TPA: MBL fold metallo-hydrolase [Candidatus Coproplasma avistercoris]|nr:MBL fold metallo-hydrolase [Candidatus Coproplasma avistercoris]